MLVKQIHYTCQYLLETRGVLHQFLQEMGIAVQEPPEQDQGILYKVYLLDGVRQISGLRLDLIMQNIGESPHHGVQISLPMDYLQKPKELILAQIMGHDFFYLLRGQFLIGVVMLVVLHKLVLDQLDACEPSVDELLDVLLSWGSVLDQTAKNREDGFDELHVGVPGGGGREVGDAATNGVISDYSVYKGNEEGFDEGGSFVREIGTEGIENGQVVFWFEVEVL